MIPPGGSLTVWSGKGAEEHAREGGPSHVFWTHEFTWDDNGESAVLVKPSGEESERSSGMTIVEEP